VGWLKAALGHCLTPFLVGPGLGRKASLLGEVFGRCADDLSMIVAARTVQEFYGPGPAALGTAFADIRPRSLSPASSPSLSGLLGCVGRLFKKRNNVFRAFFLRGLEKASWRKDAWHRVAGPPVARHFFRALLLVSVQDALHERFAETLSAKKKKKLLDGQDVGRDTCRRPKAHGRHASGTRGGVN